MPKTVNKPPLYIRKVAVNTHKKLDKIASDLNVPKWLIADHILGMALGTTKGNKIDLSKYLKGF